MNSVQARVTRLLFVYSPPPVNRHVSQWQNCQHVQRRLIAPKFRYANLKKKTFRQVVSITLGGVRIVDVQLYRIGKKFRALVSSTDPAADGNWISFISLFIAGICRVVRAANDEKSKTKIKMHTKRQTGMA